MFFSSANHSIPSFRTSRNKNQLLCRSDYSEVVLAGIYITFSRPSLLLLAADTCFVLLLVSSSVSSFHHTSVHWLSLWSKRVSRVCSMYPQTPSGFAGQMPYGQATPGRQGDDLDEYYEPLPPQWSCVETVGQPSVTSVRCFSSLTKHLCGLVSVSGNEPSELYHSSCISVRRYFNTNQSPRQLLYPGKTEPGCQPSFARISIQYI